MKSIIKKIAFAAFGIMLTVGIAGCYDDPEKMYRGAIEDISIEALTNGNQNIFLEGPFETVYYKKVDKNGKRTGKWSTEWPEDRERVQGGISHAFYDLILTNGRAYKIKEYKSIGTGVGYSFVESLWHFYCFKYAGFDIKMGCACDWNFDKNANTLALDFLKYKVEQADISGITLSFESDAEYEKRFGIAYLEVHQFNRKSISASQLSAIKLYNSSKDLHLAMLQIMRADCGDILEGYGRVRYRLNVIEDNVRNDREPNSGDVWFED